jgi:hypothetical protein
MAHSLSCATIVRLNSFRISTVTEARGILWGGVDHLPAEYQVVIDTPSVPCPDRSRTTNGGSGSTHFDGVS